jgi:Ca2+-dependent lipid-binding protein
MDGALLCKSDTKKKDLNPKWNEFFAVKIPARPSKLIFKGTD